MFRGKDVPSTLGYKNTGDAIIKHVKDDNKVAISSVVKRDGNPTEIFIKQPGVYSLIFKSKLLSAEAFQDWVFSEVLPSIRKTGGYQIPIKKQSMLRNETDLHYQVVKYIRKYHPGAVLIPGLGKNQDSKGKRIHSRRMNINAQLKIRMCIAITG